jgi:hypothetical protein
MAALARLRTPFSSLSFAASIECRRRENSLTGYGATVRSSCLCTYNHHVFLVDYGYNEMYNHAQ